MNNEGTQFVVIRLPHPWPSNEQLLVGGQVGGQRIEISAIDGGRLKLIIENQTEQFISQPINLNSSKPRFVILDVAWNNCAIDFQINGQALMKDVPGIAALLLTNEVEVISQSSTSVPNHDESCSPWVQNRKVKFGQGSTHRSDRRPKTIEEQVLDLQVCVLRLKHLREQTLAGHEHLLGTLAGEMRAAVYWEKDTQRDRNYDPLLLRMASLADLSLPVFFVPEVTTPAILESAVLHHVPANGPRVFRQFKTDQICDLQHAIKNTILRLGPSPGRTISGLKLIAELAHTMGAAHYDAEASDFVDVLQKLESSQSNQLTTLMCQTAETLIFLSEWVLSELRARKLI